MAGPSASGKDQPFVRGGEPPLLAFISSVMDDEMQPARDRLVTVLDGAPFLLAWAFEYTPASSQNVDWSYLEKVRRSAFVFWLVGRNTTEPVEAEINEALAADRRLVVLRLPKPTRDERSLRLLERVRPRAKYRDVADLDQLAVEATLAVNDEISRALQDLPGMSRIAPLDELGRASRARSIERWQAADVPLAQALELSDDLTVGAPPEDAVPREANPLVILRGDVGAGSPYQASASCRLRLHGNSRTPLRPFQSLSVPAMLAAI